MLAENLPAYQLELIPEQVSDVDDTLQRLAELGLIEAEDIPTFKELSESGPRFKPVTLNFRLTDEQIANFAIQRPRFPGVDFQPRLVRHYPEGELIAHAVGYVGALSKADLERLDASDYAGTAHAGKTGVESAYEGDLHGDVGVRHVISNALGRQIPTDSREMADSLPADETPLPGMNVYLSLDLELQRIATEFGLPLQFLTSGGQGRPTVTPAVKAPAVEAAQGILQRARCGAEKALGKTAHHVENIGG